jgi:hypothetical protein
MPILNYTTKISANKSIGEIQEILVEHGANKIVCDYSEDKTPSSVTFGLWMGDRMTYFSLPANYTGVLKAMEKEKKIPRSFCTKDQAVRIAWRILKDWIEAQCAIIEAGLAEMPEIFLPYAVTKSGSTLYKEIKEGQHKLLS